MAILNQDEPAHAAAAERLRADPVIWLTTVNQSGQPQSTPVWFWWQDGEFIIYGSADGPKTASIEANPLVSLHLDGNGRGGSNVIFEGRATIDPAPPGRCPARLYREVPGLHRLLRVDSAELRG